MQLAVWPNKHKKYIRNELITLPIAITKYNNGTDDPRNTVFIIICFYHVLLMRNFHVVKFYYFIILFANIGPYNMQIK